MSERMDSERVDLSALDLGADPARMELLVGRIMDAAEPELESRAAASDPFSMLQAWARPVLAMAATVSALALGILAWQASPVGAEGFVGVADVLDIEGPAYEWLMDGREPTNADMIALLEDNWP